MARTIYDVSPHDGEWQVKRRGASRAASVHDLKEDAIEAGRKLALANQPSQLVIRRQDGTIENEWTYGDDPYPPEG